nr:DUF4035 domain-containing protein [Amycolatopsis palatopharyngis]
MAYERISGPLGGRRDDILAAVVAATVANSNRGQRAAYKVDKFLPHWEPAQPLSPIELYEKARQINAALGGQIGG